MKKGKTSATLVVLALEIVSIAVLHAVKLSNTEKTSGAREVSRNVNSSQAEAKDKSIYSLAIFR